MGHAETSPETEKLRRAKISAGMKLVRLRIPNPVERPEVRAKISATHRARGITYTVRGGNGRGPTRHELMLFQALVKLRPAWLWSLGYAESNGKRRPGVPIHYKIDIVSLKKRIAIEVDGLSHNTEWVKVADVRKEEVLRSRGWFMLRFANRTVELNPNKTACMVVNSFIRSQ